MKMKCLACDVDKDPMLSESYPYDGDEFDHHDLLPSLLTIECQGLTKWGMAIMCQECWHKLSRYYNGVDMWIDEKGWDSLKPVTSADDLPEVKREYGGILWHPRHYLEIKDE